MIQLFVVLPFFLVLTTFAVYAQSSQVSLHVKDLPDLQLEENKNLTINNMTNPNVVSGNQAKLPLSFSVQEGPLHGNVNAKKATLTYRPNPNYNGPDNFTFRASVTNTTSNKTYSSNIGRVSITINPHPLIFASYPEYRAGLAFGISLGIVFGIFVIVYFVIRKIRFSGKIKPRFRDIIRDENWYPSLAIFQFLLWTGIVLFAYLGIAITRLFSGAVPLPDIPGTLILVMGISAAVPLTGAVVSNFQYAGATPTSVESTKEVPLDQIRNRLPGFKTMLMENGKVTLPRFQMFAWTWIGIIAYLGLLILEVNGKLGSFENLSVPPLPYLFVSLMGLSQVTYLTAKSVRPAFVSINEVRPGSIQLQEKNNLITILGSNFGNTGTVWIEYYPPVSDSEMGNCPTLGTNKWVLRLRKETPDQKTQKEKEWKKEWAEEYKYLRTRVKCYYDITPRTTTTTPNLKREDTRIVASLDDIMYKLKSQSYVVRVEKDGLLTYANSDATFEITNIPPKTEDLSISAEANKPLEIELKATDPDAGDQITYSKVSDPSHGTLSNVESNTGKVTYTPRKDYAGTDIFTFKANDGKADSNISKINININKAAPGQ
jgi:Bacterial Ig domain